MAVCLSRRIGKGKSADDDNVHVLEQMLRACLKIAINYYRMRKDQ